MKAHIIYPPVNVGEKALALCGKKHTVKVLWDDVDEDATICRACVDTSIMALNDALDMIERMETSAIDAIRVLRRSRGITFEENILNDAVNDATEYAEKQTAKRERKQAIEDAKALLIEEGVIEDEETTVIFQPDDTPIAPPE